jgi:carbonic anhydrase/acetyltransferase-like protein (isoleucine patch superfamily)
MLQRLINILCLLTAFSLAGQVAYQRFFAQPRAAASGNIPTDFHREVDTPVLPRTAYVHPRATLIGRVRLGEKVTVAPGASIRGDIGYPIYVGDASNVQDGAVIQALPTKRNGEFVPEHLVQVNRDEYAVYLGPKVTLAPQSQVHGPAQVDEGSFIGMQALVFDAHVGKFCVLEPGAKVIGVIIPTRRYVPAGKVITTQAAADALPSVDTRYAWRHLNDQAVAVHVALAEGYVKSLTRPSKPKKKKPAAGEEEAEEGEGEGGEGDEEEETEGEEETEEGETEEEVAQEEGKEEKVAQAEPDT